MLGERYRYFIYKMKKIWVENKPQPTIFNDVIWTEYIAYWGREDVITMSVRNKNNKVGDGGEGMMHTVGSANFATLHTRHVYISLYIMPEMYIFMH